MWSAWSTSAVTMGVRIEWPYCDLYSIPGRADIVFTPGLAKRIFYSSRIMEQSGELDFTFTLMLPLIRLKMCSPRSKTKKGMKWVKVVKRTVRPLVAALSACEAACRVCGIFDAVRCMTLTQAIDWVNGIAVSLPSPMRPMAERLGRIFFSMPLVAHGLAAGYLQPTAQSSTLSTANVSACEASPAPCATGQPACFTF